jgi:O-antigen/teichoic acid export membrane protein
MPTLLRRWLPEISFLRKLSIMAGGTLVGQALVVLSSPFLTRFFTPEEFGVFAVFAALAVILATIGALRFEFAVLVAADDEDAAALVMVTIVAAAAMALLQAFLIWRIEGWFVAVVDTPALAGWLWLLPPVTFTWCMGSALAQWSIRCNTYAVNGFNRTLQLGSQAGGQVALGLLGAGTPGLIIGYVGGYVVMVLHYLRYLPTSDRLLFLSRRPAALWRNARVHWRYPAFAFPSGLLHSSCDLAPVFLIAALYGPTMAGWYGLGQRVLAMPMQMLSQVASQIFLGETRGLDGDALYRLFLRTLTLFTGLGVLGMLPLLLYGPELFALVFGAPWRDAGLIVQLLVPLYLVRFIVQPVSQLLYALKRQAIHLLSAGFNALALIASFGAGYAFELNAYATILLYSLSSSLAFLFYLGISWHLARQGKGVAHFAPPSHKSDSQFPS